MKKLLPILFVTLFTGQAKAQIGWGVSSAVLFNTSTLTGFDNKFPNITFSSGVIAKITKGGFMFRPGINYMQTGISNKRSLTSTTDLYDILNLKNLELPLDVTYPIKLKNSKILFSVAPTITLAIGGTVKREVRNLSGAPLANGTVIQDINFGSGANEVKRLDVGTKFGIGYEMKDGIQINASLKYGFSNLSNAANSKFKTNHFALSASWFFLQ
jgi:Outer membrane protein beta-barrel domain